MKPFQTRFDAMGTPTVAANLSDSRHVVVLTAGTPKTVAVPAGARTVLINATGPVWVQYAAAAALPIADQLDGHAAELNPAMRDITGIASLDLVAPADCAASIAFYG
ncbi:NAD/NADP transhydrogenase alpha subunit-like protein [Azospirillum sp.]|uniref:NAD/NADP transhydrogenase alpha subunit-like protein n=1 Tax=Azospirillum sp. TaxID=34012 RepID=UPI002D34A906|nr:NAD/NADP transhydrogenase alpha subunit-like protein [Azospirillum sp.]HYD64569.1 NAD/NADP transhydrogenase alpha subunit-like protein [Azospirillum sp.]